MIEPLRTKSTGNYRVKNEMIRGVWMTFRGQMTRAQDAALRAGGYVFEVRGGDPKFSTNGKSADGCLYTRVRTYVRRSDSARLTAKDRRVVALVASRPNVGGFDTYGNPLRGLRAG